MTTLYIKENNIVATHSTIERTNLCEYCIKLLYNFVEREREIVYLQVFLRGDSVVMVQKLT